MSIQGISSTTMALDSQLARHPGPQPNASQPDPATALETAAAPQGSTATAATTEQAGPTAAIDHDTLLQAVKEVETAIAPVANDLRFSIDDDTGRTIVKLVDAHTDEVIRQMPSEEVLAMAKAIDKLKGMLIEQKA